MLSVRGLFDVRFWRHLHRSSNWWLSYPTGLYQRKSACPKMILQTLQHLAVPAPVMTLFQHDNPRPHISVPAATQRPVWPLPQNSPHLNPVKHFWHMLGADSRCQAHPTAWQRDRKLSFALFMELRLTQPLSFALVNKMQCPYNVSLWCFSDAAC